jgi:membrane fusion protein, multidrug efflux system
MKKKNIIIVVIVALVAVILLLRIAPWKKAASPAAQAGARMSAVNVKAHVITAEKLEDRIIVTGSLLSNESVELRSETAGKVTGIFFREGSRVNKGDLLVQINDAELQAQLMSAVYQKKLAEGTESRQRQQLEIEAISQEDYDVALNRVHTLEAEMQLLEAQLQKTKIIAPFSGQIGLRYVSEGSFVSSNTAIATLVDTDPIKIEFSVPERYSNVVKTGQEILFRVQGRSEKNRAVVYAVEPEIDSNTRSLHLRAQCPNSQGQFIPGSFAEVELLLSVSDQAIMAPSQSLIPELDKQTIYLFKSGKAVSVPVEIGIRTSEKIQILTGAAPGDTVITSGILQMRPNVAVKIIAFE